VVKSLSTRIDDVVKSLSARIDETNKRIDDLGVSLPELMKQTKGLMTWLEGG
jgi:uncharacterized protein YoxC